MFDRYSAAAQIGMSSSGDTSSSSLLETPNRSYSSPTLSSASSTSASSTSPLLPLPSNNNSNESNNTSSIVDYRNLRAYNKTTGKIRKSSSKKSSSFIDLSSSSSTSVESTGGSGGGGFACNSFQNMKKACLVLIVVFLAIQFLNYVLYVSSRGGSSALFSLNYVAEIYKSNRTADTIATIPNQHKNVTSFTLYTELDLKDLTNLSNMSQVIMVPVFRRLYLINRTAIDKESLEHYKNDMEHEQMFVQIREVVAHVYESIERPYEYCSLDSDLFDGYLDSNKILSKVNLTDYVKFYKDDKKRDNKQKKSALSSASSTSTTTTTSLIHEEEIHEEVWQQFRNSNSMSVLNISSDMFGIDGDRIQLGGQWKPKQCLSSYKLGVIIPFRDRLSHLKVLINYLHLVLQRQQIDYRIFVAEPTTPLDVPFNKGRVMNAAYLEALKLNPAIDCFVFHDVDLVPEDDRNLYSCPNMPRHMSVAIDKFDYILPYSYLVGGVFNIRTEHYHQINGYSNLYWGWGGEDDDLALRIESNKLKIQRPPTELARYKMMKHEGQKLNPNRHKYLKATKKRYKQDGVNNVKYKLEKTTLFSGFTHFLFDVGLPDPAK